MPASKHTNSRCQPGVEILVLSNGSGEDRIGATVMLALLDMMPKARIRALPLVGDGQRYAEVGVETIEAPPICPDGGFLYLRPFWLVADLAQGLLGRISRWRRIIRDWRVATQGARTLVVAVGDVVPLALARLSGADLVFIGCAKSEYYRRDRTGPLRRAGFLPRLESRLPSVYGWLERAQMTSPRCKAVFLRDSLTAERLRPFGLPVQDLGNPMMDGLEPRALQIFPAADHVIALLPGSRHGEALANWRLQLARLAEIIETLIPESVLFLAPIPQAARLAEYRRAALQSGWVDDTVRQQGARDRSGGESGSHRREELTWTGSGTGTLLIVANAFGDCAHRADLAIAQAGTATEQVAGLGKPIVSFPGAGPQFVHRFAESQSRLLGPLVHYFSDSKIPGAQVARLIRDQDRREAWRAAGLERMGRPGASERIARRLVELIGEGADDEHVPPPGR